jgi:hypothetical protein
VFDSEVSARLAVEELCRTGHADPALHQALASGSHRVCDHDGGSEMARCVTRGMLLAVPLAGVIGALGVALAVGARGPLPAELLAGGIPTALLVGPVLGGALGALRGARKTDAHAHSCASPLDSAAVLVVVPTTDVAEVTALMRRLGGALIGAAPELAADVAR